MSANPKEGDSKDMVIKFAGEFRRRNAAHRQPVQRQIQPFMGIDLATFPDFPAEILVTSRDAKGGKAWIPAFDFPVIIYSRQAMSVMCSYAHECGSIED